MPPKGNIDIIRAQSEEQIALIRELFVEYAASLDFQLCFQSFEQELTALPGQYAPPDGRLLLAMDGSHAAGCVALRKIDQQVCEMKRLFVRPAFRGLRIGRLLTERLLAEARTIGYTRMRLDTVKSMVLVGKAVLLGVGVVEGVGVFAAVGEGPGLLVEEGVWLGAAVQLVVGLGVFVTVPVAVGVWVRVRVRLIAGVRVIVGE